MRALIVVALTFLVQVSTWTDELRITFIGNEAVHLSDGKNTVVTDFPYESGAYGYMSYDEKALPPMKGAFHLITHAHGDHWNLKLFKDKDAKVIGPSTVTDYLPPKQAIQSKSGSAARLGDLDIIAIATPHKMAKEHFSYLIVWRGLRIYFAGDTENPSEILHRRDIDVMFVTPWLIRTIARQNLSLDCERLVVYHQKEGEKFPDFQGVLRMKQGDSFSVPIED